ncbi:MAG: hypothetical protein ACFFCQ_03995 [Promethearchaeota archaeon]
MRYRHIVMILGLLLLLESIYISTTYKSCADINSEDITDFSSLRTPLQTPNITIVLTNYSFSPNNFSVDLGETVNITLISGNDSEHGFAIDEFGVNVTVPINATVSTSFIANITGDFIYYSPIDRIEGHPEMNGTMTVIPLPLGIELLEIDKLTEYPKIQNVGENISYGIKCTNHFENETLYNVNVIEDVSSQKKRLEVINTSSTWPETIVNYTKTKVNCTVPEFFPKSAFYIWINISIIDSGSITLTGTNVSFVFANGTEAFSISNVLIFSITKTPETSVISTLPTAKVLFPIFDNFDNDILISGIILIVPLIFLFFTSFILSKIRKS